MYMSNTKFFFVQVVEMIATNLTTISLVTGLILVLFLGIIIVFIIDRPMAGVRCPVCLKNGIET